MEVQNNYELLLSQIKDTVIEGRVSAVKAARRQLVLTYWQIGRHIVEYEQKGEAKAVYGSRLLEQLSKDLSHQLGKGFNRSNLIYMRLCYLRYPEPALLSHQLTWAHFVELLKIDQDLERQFYEQQAIKEKWTIRELKRQKSSALFLRLAASKDKDGILQLASEGQKIETPTDIIRDMYVFEFLKIPEPYRISEKELEIGILPSVFALLCAN